MYPMRLGEILDIMGGIPRNIDETELVVGISTDSREIGEGELFFAIRGDRFDGHDFVKDAVNSGAVAVVVDRPVDDSLPYILVEDTSSAMLLLACRYVSRFDTTIVAVTGSFGKTTTKELISAALSEAFRVVKAPKSFNNMVGLSKTLFAVEGDTDYVVVELGTNHPGEIAKLTEHLWIDDLILTAIGKTHVGYFGSVSAILEEKLSSLRRLKPDGRLFVNVDNPHLRAFEYERHYYGYGLGEEADFHIECIENRGFDGFYMRMMLPDGRSVEISPRMLGVFNAHNVAAAVAVGWSEGIDPEILVHGIEGYRGINGRMDCWCSDKGFYIIDDSYNANPDAMRAAIDTLMGLPAVRRIAVVGDMLELGESSESEHMEVGRYAAAKGVDEIWVTGKFAEFVVKGVALVSMNVKTRVFDSNLDIVEFLNGYLRSGDVVLIKGSRACHMEDIVSGIGGLKRC